MTDINTITVIWQRVLDVFVAGIPAPGGSKRGFPIKRANGTIGVAMTDAGGERTKRWRECVSSQVAAVWQRAPLDEPIRLDVTFCMPRPKHHYGTGRNADVLKASATDWHTTKPDRTKLLRSTEDALTGIVWRDDSAIVDGSLRKIYGERPGAIIAVWVEEGTETTT